MRESRKSVCRCCGQSMAVALDAGVEVDRRQWTPQFVPPAAGARLSGEAERAWKTARAAARALGARGASPIELLAAVVASEEAATIISRLGGDRSRLETDLAMLGRARAIAEADLCQDSAAEAEVRAASACEALLGAAGRLVRSEGADEIDVRHLLAVFAAEDCAAPGAALLRDTLSGGAAVALGRVTVTDERVAAPARMQPDRSDDTATDSDLASHTGGLTAIERLLAAMRDKLSAIGTRLDRLETRFDADLRAGDGARTTLRDRDETSMAGGSGRLTAMREAIRATIREELSAVGTRLDRLEARGGVGGGAGGGAGFGVGRGARATSPREGDETSTAGGSGRDAAMRRTVRTTRTEPSAGQGTEPRVSAHSGAINPGGSARPGSARPGSVRADYVERQSAGRETTTTTAAVSTPVVARGGAHATTAAAHQQQSGGSALASRLRRRRRQAARAAARASSRRRTRGLRKKFWNALGERRSARQRDGWRRRRAWRAGNRSVERRPTTLDILSDAAAPETEANEERGKRFYLEAGDDIVESPGIGPRTAERFRAIGIHTVRDLLRADAGDAARRIATRWIRPETIAAWQAQARLVATVPWLRGTHAQLLVGAGFPTVEAITAAEPGGVAAGILRFAQTREGRSVLRDGAPPEAERIDAWLRNASDAEVERVA